MRDRCSRLKGRLFCWLLISTIGLGAALAADPATTRVTDKVYRADGSAASGVVLISWPAFTTADNKAVAAGSKSIDLGPQGLFAVDLVPNANAIPAGTLYRVIYKTDGETTTEYWSVGTMSPTTIAAVRTTPGSGTAAVSVSRQYVDSVTAGKANDTAVVHNSGSESITGTKNFSAPPSVPAPLQPADAANKAYVDEAVAALGAGSFVSKTGDSMTGPLNLPSDPQVPAQAATKHYVDGALTAKAGLVSGLVPTAELGSGTAAAVNCLKGDQTWGACGSSSNATALQGVPIDPAAPSDGQVQTYDAASGKYKPKPGGGASGNATQIQGVTVDASAPAKGQMQVFDDVGNKYKPQSKAWIDPRDYGAKCDNSSDDAAAFQSMFNANPGGHFVVPGSAGTPITCFFSTALTLKGAGWVLEGGGASYAGGGRGGSTMRWAASSSGLIVLNAQGPGTIRHLNLQGGENFVGAENGMWPDAILPNFTDQAGFNIFNRSISSISRTSNVTTVKTLGIANEIGCHTYSPGTQISISGVSDSSYNGLYYITAITSTQGVGCFDSFTYANTGANGSSNGGTASIANTGTSTSDGIVAGSNYLRVEDVNLQSWGRFGINCMSDSAAYWCDNDSFQRVTITNGRGIGVYLRGSDSNAGDYQQVNTQVVLAGGIADLGFLGNTWVAPNVTNAGADVASINGSPVAVSSVSCSANVCTVTTATSHGLLKGEAAVLTGLADASFQAPAGSAVFVASVPSGTTLTYNFTHGTGSTTGGAIRLANATELFTLAGTGQNAGGTAGTGFSYWISGMNDNRTVNNPYCEGSSGPLKFGGATLVWGGAFGCPQAAGFGYYPSVQSGSTNGMTNIVVFDKNISGGTPDKGTDLMIRGGHSSSQASSIRFMDYNLTNLRWLFNDTSSSGLQGFHIYRGNFVNPRLDLYDPNGVNAVPGWSFLNGEGANGNVVLQPTGTGGTLLGWNSGSNWSGVKIFDGGTGSAVATVDKAGKGTFNGGVSTTKLSGITDTTLVSNLNADMVGGKHASELGGTADWNSLLNKPGSFPPSTHTHAEADITNLQSDLGLKANLASPSLTGTPTAPTAATSDNSTAIATTAFVKAQTSVGEQSTYTGDKTISGNLTVTGQLTVNGPYQVESSAATSAMTGAATGNSKFGFDSDGKLKVSENAGAVLEVAKRGAIDGADIASGTIASARIPDLSASYVAVDGTAATATALAATPTICGAGSAATGVDASGNAVGCFTPAGGSGGGGTISVNGAGVTNPNFGASPAAPGGTSVVFQSSGSNVSGYIGAATGGGPGVVTANAQTFGGDKTFNGKVTAAASASGKAGFNLPSGVAPSAPASGDVWNESGVLKIYNGAASKQLAFSDGVPNSGSCTNQVVTALTNGGAPSCATVTSAFVDASILKAGPLYQPDANTVEQYNGATAQVHSLYGTRTDASNYERLETKFDAANNYFALNATRAGTGVQRGICFEMFGACRWKVGTDYSFGAYVDNTYDIGAAAAGRPRDLFLGRALTVGTTASIGSIITKYDGISTAGTGVSPIYATQSSTGLTGSQTSTTLCSSTQCTQGQYVVEYYVNSAATCATAGLAALAVNLAWTDETGAKNYASVPLAGTGVSGGNSLGLGNTANFASGEISLWSAGANAITYSSSYTPCTSGTAAYALRVAVRQVQ